MTPLQLAVFGAGSCPGALPCSLLSLALAAVRAHCPPEFHASGPCLCPHHLLNSNRGAGCSTVIVLCCFCNGCDWHPLGLHACCRVHQLQYKGSAAGTCRAAHGRLLAPAGAADGLVKVWDMRILSEAAAHIPAGEEFEAPLDAVSALDSSLLTCCAAAHTTAFNKPVDTVL